MKRLLAAGVLALALPLLPAGPVSAADTTVELTADNRFDPVDVTVSVGDTITFDWSGGFHNVVFDDGPTSGAPVGIPNSWSTSFDTPGTYQYICEVHAPAMAGTVTVDAAGGATTTIAATATTTTTGGGGSTTTAAGATTTSAASATTAPGSTAPGSTATATGVASPSSYPYTGPESTLVPRVGLVLAAAGGIGLFVRRRRR